MYGHSCNARDMGVTKVNNCFSKKTTTLEEKLKKLEENLDLMAEQKKIAELSLCKHIKDIGQNKIAR